MHAVALCGVFGARGFGEGEVTLEIVNGLGAVGVSEELAATVIGISVGGREAGGAVQPSTGGCQVAQIEGVHGAHANVLQDPMTGQRALKRRKPLTELARATLGDHPVRSGSDRRKTRDEQKNMLYPRNRTTPPFSENHGGVYSIFGPRAPFSLIGPAPRASEKAGPLDFGFKSLSMRIEAFINTTALQGVVMKRAYLFIPLLLGLSALSMGCADAAEVACGDGMQTGVEACDDGNRNNLDGCDDQCVLEPGWSCDAAGCMCAQGFFGPSCLACPECGGFGVCASGPLGDGACVCDPGYQGEACDECADGFQATADGACTFRQFCEPDTCSGHGTCDDSELAVSCLCDAGFQGERCEEDVDECAAGPCLNFGKCTNTEGAYLCECPPGFEGTDCEVDTDECQSTPCMNGATCLDLLDGFSCECLPGWTGTLCEADIDECTDALCLNGGVCVDLVGDYVCECPPGFAGAHCDLNIDDCTDEPCQNGGLCVDGQDAYSCFCLAGFEGTHCEVNVDDCAVAPCQNGGLCVDKVAGWICQCAPGWAGETCGDNINECALAVCLHGGSCVDKIAGYSCQCTPGWEGTYCETDIDECGDDPCVNGTCVEGLGSFTCACTVGWTGFICNKEIDECLENPCIHGACTDALGDYSCACEPGWEGKDCDVNTDDCAPNPCLNAGTCADDVNGYSCDCALGFDGEDCETNLDDCVENACENGATCVDGIAAYTCDCMDNFTGDFCQFFTDPCLEDPCQNGGACLVKAAQEVLCVDAYPDGLGMMVSDYCPAGSVLEEHVCGASNMETFLYGPFEKDALIANQEPEDFCNVDCDCNSICLRCGFEGGGGYLCECPIGFDGQHCENNIDDCVPNPCQNGGSCIDGVGTFVCDCPDGTFGDTCASTGVMITNGDGYGHHGACSGWNDCGSADTCALWACQFKGYAKLVSFDQTGACNSGVFNTCHLFNSPNNLDQNWGSSCAVMGVGQITCSN